MRPQDGILAPWEGVLDLDSFGVRIPRADLPRMIDILRAIPRDRVAALRAGLRAVWERFTYSSLALAERRRRCGTNGWSAEADGCKPVGRGASGPNTVSGEVLANPRLRGHDAIDTLMRVLHTRLVDRSASGAAPATVGDLSRAAPASSRAGGVGDAAVPAEAMPANAKPKAAAPTDAREWRRKYMAGY